ncbi:MAG: hypothetical protein ACREEL_08370 [Stellaceae bacterium]
MVHRLSFLKKVMVALAIIISGGLVYVLVSMAPHSDQQTDAPDPLSDSGTVYAALATLPGLNRDVEIDKAIPDHYELALQYPESAFVSRGEPEADSESIVRAILAQLVKKGRVPYEEDISIFVFASQDASGETGKHLVHVYGYATYDHSLDRISYSRCTGSASSC